MTDDLFAELADELWGNDLQSHNTLEALVQQIGGYTNPAAASSTRTRRSAPSFPKAARPPAPRILHRPG